MRTLLVLAFLAASSAGCSAQSSHNGTATPAVGAGTPSPTVASVAGKPEGVFGTVAEAQPVVPFAIKQPAIPPGFTLHDVRVSSTDSPMVTLLYVRDPKPPGTDLVITERQGLGFDVPPPPIVSRGVTIAGTSVTLFSIDSATTARPVAVWHDTAVAYRVMLDIPARQEVPSLLDIVTSLLQ